MIIEMNASVLLIIVINLFTLQQCVGFPNDDDEPNLTSQLLDINCKDISECNRFLGSQIVKVACMKEKCHCMDLNNKTTVCVPKEQKLSNELGLECPCLIDHSICNNITNKCECKTNFTSSDDNKHCVPVTSQLNEFCEIDPNCQRAEPFAVCMLTKTCECQQGFVNQNNTCFSKLEKIEITCNSHTACSNITKNSVCALSSCVCKKGFVASKIENKCLHNVHYGDGCEENLQCQSIMGVGGKCNHGKCSCKNGYKVGYTNGEQNLTICIREIEFGIDCTTAVDCISENEQPQESSMVCKNNLCDCRYGYMLDGKDAKTCTKEDAVGAAIQNGINSHYFVLLFTTIFIFTVY
uniref:CSON001560 protein n=1 Tax=Culicoides sonorensis TaxID=179676 RepID=A0A336K6L6_CULSO